MSEATVTPKEFLEGIVAEIKAKAESFAEINWVLGYDFTASNDGIWHIIIEDGEPRGPFEEENSEAILTVVVSFPYFVEASKKKFNPLEAQWNAGKMRWLGDPMVAHRFHRMLAS